MTVLVIAVLYLAVCLAIGLRAGKGASDSATGYVAGDRAMGTVLMYFMTGATIFSAFAFLGAPGWAYSRGVAVLYILGFGTLGFIPFYWLGPRASRLGRAFGFVTQAEMVARRFSLRWIALAMALVSLAAFVPYLAIQMRGAGFVFSAMTGGRVSTEVGAALVYGVVLAYVLKSGVLGVGWTNTFQGVFMLVLAWVLGLYLPYLIYGGVGPMFARIAMEKPELLSMPGLQRDGSAWGWDGYTSDVLVLAIGFSFWPHLFMKAFTARSETILRRTVVLYPTFQLFLVPIILIGFAGVLFPFDPALESPDQVLPTLLTQVDLPALVVGLFCAGALAASMSSGDAIMHSAASILVRDGWVTGLQRKLGPQAERRAIRALLFVIAVLAYVVAMLFREDLVGILRYAYGPVTQLAPVVVAALYWRRATGAGALAGLIVGIGTTLLVYVKGGDWGITIHGGALGLAANVTTLVVVSLLTSERNPGARDEFLDAARQKRA